MRIALVGNRGKAVIVQKKLGGLFVLNERVNAFVLGFSRVCGNIEFTRCAVVREQKTVECGKRDEQNQNTAAG